MKGEFFQILENRSYRFKLLPYTESWRLGDLPFRSGPDRQFRAYSYRKGYAKTLLVEFSTVKGEFSPISQIRFYRLKSLNYTASILIFRSNFNWSNFWSVCPAPTPPTPQPRNVFLR